MAKSAMKKLASWKFIKKNMPMAERYKQKNQAKIWSVSPIHKNMNPRLLRKSENVLLCGDGGTLPEDVNFFTSLGIDHDVYCVNRSMLYFERPITHWAAIDGEESTWFSENLNKKVMPNDGRIMRHTIGHCPIGFDVGWRVNQKFENEAQKDIWAGNSGYFGVLTSVSMGYKKIIIAGIPLNTDPHWYERKDIPGPNWIGQTYRTWMDYKMKIPEASRIRSLSGYTKFIFGGVDEKWLLK
jgi:hypothetical protein